jgi:hypothetical protein
MAKIYINKNIFFKKKINKINNFSYLYIMDRRSNSKSRRSIGGASRKSIGKTQANLDKKRRRKSKSLEKRTSATRSSLDKKRRKRSAKKKKMM